MLMWSNRMIIIAKMILKFKMKVLIEIKIFNK